jgi:anti-sigma-K factor RskA
METKEYINSGILELYVYGLLTDNQNLEVYEMAKKHQEIDAEIINIEKSILNLSSSFAPFLSVENFEKIKSKLQIKHGKVVQLEPKNNKLNYMGWAAAAVFLIGFGFFYNQQISFKEEVFLLKKQKANLNKVVEAIENKNLQNKKALNIIRDSKNAVVSLVGQTASPRSFAKVYWNKTTQSVYVDASGLPKPPKGKVYQVWSLKLKPSLTPTSIGLLKDFSENSNLFFEVRNTNNAEAFGITLEPEKGSKKPTMSQLYTLGMV